MFPFFCSVVVLCKPIRLVEANDKLKVFGNFMRSLTSFQNFQYCFEKDESKNECVRKILESLPGNNSPMINYIGDTKTLHQNAQRRCSLAGLAFSRFTKMILWWSLLEHSRKFR